MPAYNAASTLQATFNDFPGVRKVIILVDDCRRKHRRLAEKLGMYCYKTPEEHRYSRQSEDCYKAALERGADIIVMLHPVYNTMQG
jgi:hypothetical protein